MRKINAWLTLPIIVIAALALTGCNPPPTPRSAAENRVNYTPVQIAEADGVRLWKVYDSTKGGAQYVYFTSRGDTYNEQTCGKSCRTRTLVPGQP